MATLLAARGYATRGVILICGARPGWARQCPDLFAAPLRQPALVVSSVGDPICESGGPVEQVVLAHSIYIQFADMPKVSLHVYLPSRCRRVWQLAVRMPCEYYSARSDHRFKRVVHLQAKLFEDSESIEHPGPGHKPMPSNREACEVSRVLVCVCG